MKNREVISNKPNHLVYKKKKVYIVTDVSKYLNKHKDYVYSKIRNQTLIEGEHYFDLGEEEMKLYLDEIGIYVPNANRLQYFITETGFSLLEELSTKRTPKKSVVFERYSKK